MKRFNLYLLIFIAVILIIGNILLYNYRWEQTHESYYGKFTTTSIFGRQSDIIEKFYVIEKIGCWWKISIEGHTIMIDVNGAILYDTKTHQQKTIYCD